MAGTLNVLLVIVCLAVLWTRVQGEVVPCFAMDICRQDFQKEARVIGHEKQELCRLLKIELECFQGARSSCSTEQTPFAQNQIQNAQKDRTSACGASWIEASHWLMTFSAILAVIYHRRF